MLAAGKTPNLAGVLPGAMWEKRHTPGSFTYAAHHAFFAGFLPTPADAARERAHGRLFAARFAGSETTTDRTAVFDTANVVSGFASRGYHTVCVGGVGFFNKLTPLGSVLPGLFAESHWSPQLGVTDPRSTENQVRLAVEVLAPRPAAAGCSCSSTSRRSTNPTGSTCPARSEDSIHSHAAALAYVDGCLPPLFDAIRRRGPCLCVLCSDHGTCYGEDGYTGHRVAHPAVWTVPYAEFVLA